MAVPVTTSFEDIYPENATENQRQRWNNLLVGFKKEYGHAAAFVSRSPGRVNIIGEHTDYSLYECLPMAVTADVLLAVSLQEESRVRIANINPSKFPSRQFEIPQDGDVTIDASSHEWSNYFKAGMKGAIGLLQRQGFGQHCMGMNILVDGSVPAGGGLSSSAAFVCASALATMRANGVKEVDKNELVEVAIVSERAVGVNSGGLDQTASVLALRGSALLVSFKPKLKAEPVQFPTEGPELVFLIAQSLVTADKHVTAPIHYNLRVVECTLAAAFLAKIFGLKNPLPRDSSPLGLSLRGFHDAFFEEREGISDNTRISSEEYRRQLQTLLGMIDDYVVQQDGYTREQIADLLEISVDELNGRYMGKFSVRADRFLLRQRAMHVFSEALRVQQFMALLNATDEEPENLPAKLGDLLVETQRSCREDHDCSCPELDELCQIALDAGAWGGRLTGAGWGGCSVHLVPKGRVDKVKAAWEMKYYRRKWPDISEEELQKAIIVSKPGGGSLVWDAAGRDSFQALSGGA